MSATAYTFELDVPVTRATRTPPYVARIPMTAEEFLAWDYGNRPAEWVDGEAYIHMTTTNAHERVLQFLNTLLGVWTSATDTGLVRRGPYAMRARPDGPIREPDLMVVRREHVDRVTEQLLVGPADLIVEVVSDDSPVRDRRTKYREYLEAGVAEYSIIDPRPGQRRADAYVASEGRYEPLPQDADGRIRSAVLPEFWLRREWLWDEGLSPLRCLAEILGPDRLAAALR